MQRAFSTFPGGWPGVGLLLLRAAIGSALVGAGAACLAAPGPTMAWAWTAGVLAVAEGALLLVGFLTPIAGVAAGITAVAIVLWPPAPLPFTLGPAFLVMLMAMVAAAVALLGPGAVSLDARRFGRREIRIPRGSDSAPGE